jgi:3-oxoacyl-[acyl-carrier-protein] synthase III
MAFLRAFGRYVPSRVVPNAELAARLGCEADWILNASGIAERRWAADQETVVDMAAAAAGDCLHRASLNTTGVGMVIVASGTAGRRFPGPAAETAARLGLAGVPALDVPMASAGSLFGLAMAARFADTCGAVLLIATEKMSAVIETPPLDRNTAILFGDGAGACLIHPSEGRAELREFALHSDGAFADALRLEFGEPIHMDGRTVIMQAARKVPAAIREVLERSGRPADSVAAFLMHQANQNLIVKIAQSIGVAPEKFYSNIASYGNTSSASMLIAASEWTDAGGFHRDDAVVFAAFGAGFHWGAVLAVGS